MTLIPRDYNPQIKDELINSQLKCADIPAMYAAADITDFRPFEHEYKLFIYGNVGTGKSHLASALTKDFIHKCYGKAKYVTFAKLLGAIKEGMKNNEDQYILNNYLNYDLLVLDDLGAEKITEWVEEILFKIVDDRYAQKKFLIVTSNLQPSQLVDAYGLTGLRFASRIKQMCKTFELTGKDRRLAK